MDRSELQDKFQRLPNEEDKDYIQRVVLLKDLLDCSWSEFAKIIEDASGIHKDESRFRKLYHSMTDNQKSEAVLSDDESSYLSNLQDILLEIKKERAKLSDERVQNGRYVRRLAREESIKEIAESFADRMSKEKALSVDKFFEKYATNSVKEGILLISDWHYGLEFENAYNRFNPEICRERVSRLVAEVIKRCEENCIRNLTIINLSDLIAGRIHTQIRIQSREDVISQIMEVSEILAEMIVRLSEKMHISYFDCLDNHSRIEPNKSESLDLESLARFIPFYLRQRLKGFDVSIYDNEFSEDIITCTVCGHNVAGVHGDKDKPLVALDKITLVTRQSYDLMCTAHLHHFSADEKCGCVTVGNGSLMGTDDYAMNLRLHSEPSQTLIIATPQNVCDAIYKINLGK